MLPVVPPVQPMLARLARELPRGDYVYEPKWDGFDFGALLARLHPAASRAQHLARATPASFVAFDLLAVGDLDLREGAFVQRRAALETLLQAPAEPLALSPVTEDPNAAETWLDAPPAAGLDGVVAKDRNATYNPASARW